MTDLAGEEILLLCVDNRDDGPALTAALGPDGEIILISDHRAKSLKGLVCMACGTDLIAVKGPERAWHFRHRSDRDCRHGGETALHMLAKALLEQRPEILLPAIMVETRDLSEEIRPSQWVMLSNVQLEQREDGFVPDVQADIETTPIFIEVRVTHAVDNLKAQRIAARGVSTVEIDLSGLPRRASLSMISEALRHKAPRTWIFSKLGAMRAAQQREKEKRHDAEKAEKLRAEIEHVASRIAMSPATRAASRKEEANARRAKRLGFEPLLATAMAGDNAFTVAPVVWKATLIELLILEPCRGVSPSGVFGDDQCDGSWSPSHWKTPSWSGYPPAPVTLHEAVGIAERHQILVKPGARVGREIANGIRLNTPGFRSGIEAVHEFLKCAVELGMMTELRGWGPKVKFAASTTALKKVWREQRCLETLVAIEAASRTNFGREAKAAWMEKWRPSEMAATDFEGLLDDLEGIAAAFEEPYRPPRDLRGLPLGDAMERLERHRDTWIKSLRTARRDSVIEAAHNKLGEEADEWLHRTLPMLAGKSPVDLASESEDGLRRANQALATTAEAQQRLKAAIDRGIVALGDEAMETWLMAARNDDGLETVEGFVRRYPDKITAVEREIDGMIAGAQQKQQAEDKRRALVSSRMNELEKLAQRVMAHDPIAADLLLRNAHPDLGGRRPVEACETKQGYEAAAAMIRRAGEKKRLPRF